MTVSDSIFQDYVEIYLKHRLANLKQPVLEIDVREDHLLTFCISRGIEKQIYDEPEEFLDKLRKSVLEVIKIYNDEIEDIKIRIKNIPKRNSIPEVRKVENVDKFVSFEGVVRKITSPAPYVAKASFECSKCGAIIPVRSLNGKIPKPDYCPHCHARSFRRLTEQDEVTDCQVIEVQELPEGLQRQPESIKVLLLGDLVNTVYPGDKIIVNGILRKFIDRNKSRGEFFVEAISVEFLQEDIRNLNITEEDIQKIKELAKDPNIYDKLAKSIASSIYGYETIKLAIALQLFGGVERIESGTKKRGNIHILLVGDPSTAKSQILRSVSMIAPRAVMVDGTLMSKAGLTVTVTREESTGRWTIEAGAVVLADQGMAIIDELEKADKKELRALNEPLEQQTVSVSKAGINATLNARCSVLASANPRRGRFDRHEPIVEQIDLEPPLLSRFDLIYVILDEPDEKRDEEIARFILSSDTKDKEPPIPPDLLRKYVLYARNNVKEVKLTKEAEEKIIEFYVSLRKQSKEQGAIAITARQLEALRRLTEASAKIRLSNVATVEDAERAIELFKESLRQIAIDPESGRIDWDYAIQGISATQRDRLSTVKNIIKELQDSTDWGASEDAVLARAEELGMSKEKAKEAIEKLKRSGEIYSPRSGYYRVFGGG
ncbi:minichromosome maintenance protein MCM [Archaeoglobus profundus]|uniref:DNA helicase n=1 Tax=Archaeoglobus profundus (strain DSM 5631 / JCM 9629 / NBRC 100127 / Av18) TaxID=572546 RepID=D2RHX0_ARCPA|nr:MCM family protein [Archaeoglobus profundus DSM 5631]